MCLYFLKNFDMDRSGVGLTWNYMFDDTQMPIFLSYIQDEDLYTHKISNTIEFVTYFYLQNFNF